MENIGLLKQFSMDRYIGNLHNSIYEIVQAKDDEKIMKEIGYIVWESMQALYAYKRNRQGNAIIFHAIAMAVNEKAAELSKNDLRLAEMLGE